jgi:hypothetical protein
MNAPPQFPLARQPAGVAPLRRPGSVRRTTSVDSTWPDGAGHSWIMEGHARDIYTPASGAPPELIEEGEYELKIAPNRQILELEVSPADVRASQLVGIRAGGDSRRAISEVLGDLSGGPLYQILDDFAGASLVAQWIWSRWDENWQDHIDRAAQHKSHGRGGDMLNICTGFAEGSTALAPGRLGDPTFHNVVPVGQLEDPEDLPGWHAMPRQSGPAMRRARRIDVWREDGLILVDAGFQDSGTAPAGGRLGVHEYRVYAEIEQSSGILVALQALPLILPFRECPGASVKASRMIGQKVDLFRGTVLETLPSVLGCTHLNDVLRALADVPHLARRLG